MFALLLGISILASFFAAFGNRFRNPILDGLTMIAPLLYIPFILIINENWGGLPDSIINISAGLALYGAPIVLLLTSLIRHFKELPGIPMIVSNFVAFTFATWLSVNIFSAISSVGV